MFVRIKKTGNYSYVQIVENRRDGKSVKQHLVATIGQYEALSSSGKLDDLARSFLKYAKSVRTVDALREGSIRARRTVKIGPALVFERLWRELGIDTIIDEMLEGTRYKFSIERSIFLTVLHRLFDPGSDRAAERWKDDFKIEGAGGIQLHQLYRSMEWLGEGTVQMGSDPRSLKMRKDSIEERLFRRTRDLFSELEVVFFDTTSLYFEGDGGESIGHYGHSKDSRPDLKQMIVGAVLDGNGHPICCELWPGNVSDVTALMPVVEKLKDRFGISSVCIVADRGMISKDVIAQMESDERKMKYILGVRMRKTAEVRDVILGSDEPYTEAVGPRQRSKDPSPLAVREQIIEGRRYIVCRDEDQARKDEADRQAIVESLKEHLKAGDKSLVGNNGYRKFLMVTGSEHFTIDEKRIEDERRYDGMWVLRTNTDLDAIDVARKYKQLWMVEDAFRSVKSVLSTRPVYHKTDDTIRGHVFCSFLALVVLKELESRLESHGLKLEWHDIKRDLCALEEVEVEIEGQTWYLRTDLRGVCGDVFKAVGVAIPPAARY